MHLSLLQVNSEAVQVNCGCATLDVRFKFQNLREDRMESEILVESRVGKLVCLEPFWGVGIGVGEYSQ